MSGVPPVECVSDEASLAQLGTKTDRFYYHIVPSESIQRAMSDDSPLCVGKPHRIALPIDLSNIAMGIRGTLGRATMDRRSCAYIAFVNLCIDAAAAAPIYLEEIRNFDVLDADGEPVCFATKGFRLWILMDDEEFAAFNDHVAKGCSPDVLTNPSYRARTRNGSRVLVAPGAYDCSAAAICSANRLSVAISALTAGQDARWEKGLTYDPNFLGSGDDALANMVNDGSGGVAMDVDDLFDDDSGTTGSSRPDQRYFASAFYNPDWSSSFAQEQLVCWGACPEQSTSANYFVEGSDEFTVPFLSQIKQLRQTHLIPNSDALGMYALFLTPSEAEIRKALVHMYSRTGVDKSAYLKGLDSNELWDAFLLPSPTLRDPMLLENIPVPDVLSEMGGGAGPRAINDTWPNLAVFQDYVRSMHAISPTLGRSAASNTVKRVYAVDAIPDGVPKVYSQVRKCEQKLDDQLENSSNAARIQSVIWDTEAYERYCADYDSGLSLDGFMMEHMNRILNERFTLLPPQQTMAMFLWFCSHRTAETRTVRPSTAVRAGGRFATGKSKVHQVIANFFPAPLFVSCNHQTLAARTRDPYQNMLVVADEAQEPDPARNPEHFNHMLSSLSDGVTQRAFMAKDPQTGDFVPKKIYCVENICLSAASNKKPNPILGSRMVQFLVTQTLERSGSNPLHMGAIAYKSEGDQKSYALALQWQKSKIVRAYEWQSVDAIGDFDMTMYRVLMAIAMDRLGPNFLSVRMIEQCALVTRSMAAWRVTMMWELRYKTTYAWKDPAVAQLAFLQTNWIVRAIDAIRAMSVIISVNKTERQQNSLLAELKGSQIMMFDPLSHEPVRNESNPEYYETCLAGSVDKACVVIDNHMTPRIGTGNVAKLLDELMDRKHGGMPLIRWISDTKKTTRLCLLADFVDEHVTSADERVLMEALRELAMQSMPPSQDTPADVVHSRWYARLQYPYNTVACDDDVCCAKAYSPRWSGTSSISGVPAVYPHDDVLGKVVVIKIDTVEADVSGGVHDFQEMGAVGVLVLCNGQEPPSSLLAVTHVDDITITVMAIPEKSAASICAAIDAKKDHSVVLACTQTADRIPGGCSFVYHLAVTSLFLNPTVQQSGLSPLPTSLDDGAGKIKQSASTLAAGFYFLRRRSFVDFTSSPRPVDAVQFYTHDYAGTIGAAPLAPCFRPFVPDAADTTQMSLLKMDTSMVVKWDALQRVLDSAGAMDPPISDAVEEVFKMALDVEALTPAERVIVFNSHLNLDQPTSSFDYVPDHARRVTVRNPSRVQRDTVTPTPDRQPERAASGMAPKRQRLSFSAYVRPIARPDAELSDSDAEISDDDDAAPEDLEDTQSVLEQMFRGSKEHVTFTAGVGEQVEHNVAMAAYGEPPYMGMNIGTQTPMDGPREIDPRFIDTRE